MGINPDALPDGDTIIQITITGESAPLKKFILARDGKSQVCEENLGTEVDIDLTADLKTLGKIWFGDMELGAARDKGLLKVVGSSYCVNNLSKWLGASQFAPYNRRQPSINPD